MRTAETIDMVSATEVTRLTRERDEAVKLAHDERTTRETYQNALTHARGDLAHIEERWRVLHNAWGKLYDAAPRLRALSAGWKRLAKERAYRSERAERKLLAAISMTNNLDSIRTATIRECADLCVTAAINSVAEGCRSRILSLLPDAERE
jgi:hypothetical protein